MNYRNSNPVFRRMRNMEAVSYDGAVTYSSVTFRTLFLLLVAGGVGAYFYAYPFLSIGALIGAFILGFISVWVGTRNVKLAPIFGTIYAISEGYILGTISLMYASLADGIIPTAISTTFIVVLITVLLFSGGFIKVSSKFASALVVGLISVIFMSLLSMLIPSVFGGTFFYLVVFLSAILSVLFLFFDYENVRTMVEAGTAKEYSWTLAIGLMVTIVWVYMEILRILFLIANNRR